MASHIQVILKQDVDKLGQAGQLVRVRPGYARNFLLPRSLAVMATHRNVRQVEHEKAIAQRIAEKLRKDAQSIAQSLEGIVLEIEKQAGEKGRLFGSVTSQEVAALLEEKGFNIDKRKIGMPDQSIKEVGEYEVSIKLAASVQSVIKIQVKATE